MGPLVSVLWYHGLRNTGKRTQSADVPRLIRTSAIILLVFILSSCSSGGASHTGVRLLMGTYVEVTANESKDTAKKAVNSVFDELKRIEDLTSFHKPSNLTNLNDKAGTGPVAVDPELFFIISEAIKAAEKTNGAFDPTIGVVTRLWNFSGSGEIRIPNKTAIQEALTKVGYKKVRLDHALKTVELTDLGMALDLGGIAKGYALFQANKILENLGINSALVNIGGDILALGAKAPGKQWRVGVEDPRDKSALAAVVDLENKMIFTSGDYERFITVDGKRYHHIIDPKTGYPAQGLRSTTLVGAPGPTIQPFGTAIFVMGIEKGLQFVNEIEDLKAMLIDAEGKQFFSKGADKVFSTR